MKVCLNYAASNAITGDYHKWVNTPLYFAFNSYYDSDGITQANQEPLDPAVVSSVMTVFRTSYRSQAVIGNNRLQYPLYANQSAVYNGNGTNEPGLLQDGGPICFQAITPPPQADGLTLSKTWKSGKLRQLKIRMEPTGTPIFRRAI